MSRKIILYIFFISFTLFSFAQNNSFLSGRVVDESGNGLELVNIGVTNLKKPLGTTSDAKGNYKISLPSEKELKIIISCIGYAPQEISLTLKKGEKKQIDFTLKSVAENLEAIEIKGDNSR
ncbi:MAG: carboxypeptidase-like regulatory domain-containing protein, partial [Bacteroidales bacterium]|nr:carboxypeptidase-like regulatory domain-containing protein [Bacteroidales bacterium]